MRKSAWISAVLLLGSIAVYENGASTPTVVSAVEVQAANSQQVQPGQQPGTTNQPQLSNNDYYRNSNGNEVHSPAYSRGGAPAGATAQCSDGTYSFSQHRQGTCSHHGGVAKWL